MNLRELSSGAMRISERLARVAEEDCVGSMPYDELADLLSRTGEFYGHYSGACVPAVIKVNPTTGHLTDVLPIHENHALVREVGIANILSADCLRNVHGEGGYRRYAVLGLLRLLARNLSARASATLAKWWTCRIGEYNLPAYNDLAPQLVRTDWSRTEDLRELSATLQRSGIFTLPVFDQRIGVPYTADSTFNPDMGRRAWSTDGTEQGHIQKRQPPLWRRNLVFQATSYVTRPNIDRAMSAIRDPNWYRHGPIGNGLSHVVQILPMHEHVGGVRWDDANDVPDRHGQWEDPGWGNRARLHSQAEVLRELGLAILAGALWGTNSEHQASWGFIWNVEHAQTFPGTDNAPLNDHAKQNIIDAIQVLSSFLMAIQWNGHRYDFAAGSVSDWEETKIGPASRDIGAILDAFRVLDDLLNNELYASNPIISEVRQRLCDARVSGWAGPLNGLLAAHPYADFRHSERLRAYRHAGQQIFARMVTLPASSAVAGMQNAPTHGVMQFEDRQSDSSLALLFANYGRFDDNEARDGAIRYSGIHQLEGDLMEGDFTERLGMRRYGIFHGGPSRQPIFDSYLGFLADITSVIPGLAMPLFRRYVDPWFNQVAPHLEARRHAGTLTDWDRIIEQAWYFATGKRGPAPTHPSNDATTLEAMIARQSLTLPPWSAQWSLGVAAGLVAVSRAKISLLQRLIEKGEDRRVRERLRLVKRIGSRFLNLLLRTIVQNEDAEGKPVLRVNGEGLREKYNVMEAMQVIPTLDDRIAWGPGFHTLNWTRSLWKRGLDLMIQGAEMENRLNLATVGAAS